MNLDDIKREIDSLNDLADTAQNRAKKAALLTRMQLILRESLDSPAAESLSADERDRIDAILKTTLIPIPATENP